MIQLTAGVGLILAGLVMLWTQGMPLLTASRTGVLVSKSLNAQKIDRAVDPERFEKLMRQRRGGLTVPAIMIGVGLLLAGQWAWYVLFMLPTLYPN